MQKKEDIANDFEKSFEVIHHQKRLIIPSFLSLLLIFLIIFLFLRFSGISALVATTSELNAQYNALSAEDQQKTSFDTYVFSHGLGPDSWLHLINVKNIIMLITSLSVCIFFSLFFTSMSYAVLVFAVKKKKWTIRELHKLTTIFLVRLFSLKVVIALICSMPILIMFILGLILFFLNRIVGIVSFFVLGLAFVIYIIIVITRLLFSVPSMYLEKERTIRSLKHSMQITKGHFFQVFIILLIILTLNILTGFFIGSPLQTAYGYALFGTKTAGIIGNILLVLVFLLLEAYVNTFERLFLFYAYIDFKQFERFL